MPGKIEDNIEDICVDCGCDCVTCNFDHDCVSRNGCLECGCKTERRDIV